MEMNSFVSSRKQPYNLGDGSEHRLYTFLRGGGSPMMMKHPLAYGSINGNTLHPDPLYSGIVYRPTLNGGALLGENMPLEGGCDDYSEGGDLMSESSEDDFSSDDEGEIGGGVYDSYIKPAGKALGTTLYNVGKHTFHDVVVPVGKELLKKAIMGALHGGNHRVYGGLLTGTKEEFYHILKKIEPDFKLNRRHTKNDLRNEVYKHLGSTMSKKDLDTLHYLDALASYNINPNQSYGAIKTEGGLNGKKRELQEVLKAMYPDLDFKKMSKTDIIKHITGHISESKSAEAIEDYNKRLEKEAQRQAKIKKYDEEHPENDDDGYEEVIFEHPEPKPEPEPEIIQPKIKKPRGRPKVIKEPKEKKPRGRPKKEPVIKENKPRGRPKKIIQNEPLKELEDIFNELKVPKKKGRKPKTDVKSSGGKIKKLIGTKKGNTARGAIVAEVMKKKGLNLAEASKYVSQNNLY